MNNPTNPNVRVLAEGEIFIAKEMSAISGIFMPKHTASLESVLMIQEGACVIHIHASPKNLKQGDVFVVPAHVEHQIETIEDFKAVHVMPHDIHFEFCK